MRYLSSVLWVASSICAQASPLQLDALQHRLSTTPIARWKAGSTPVSHLSLAQKRRLLGVDAPDHEDYFIDRGRIAPMRNVPPAFAWSNQNGIDFTSPVLNQGICGSCAAFAAIAQMETQLNITHKAPHSPWALSAQHLFSCGGGRCETGWRVVNALDYLQRVGVPDEACFPYESGAHGQDMACHKTCLDARTRSERLLRYQTATFMFSSVNNIKQALLSGPLLTTMTVYEDFMFYQSGVYRHTTGSQLGGHAVVIEGWDDSEQAWVVRNSWGPSWGETGYFRIVWNDRSGLGLSTWNVVVPARDGSVAFIGLRDNTLLSGSDYALEVESTFPNTRRIRWKLQQAGMTMGDGALDSNGTVRMDTTAFADGLYELVALAETATTLHAAAPRRVYILNSALSGSLRATRLTDGQILKGRAVIDFNVQSSPIPPTELIFHAEHVDSGERVERSSPHIASQVAISFQTANRKNGQWDVWLEGRAGGHSIVSDRTRVQIAN